MKDRMQCNTIILQTEHTGACEGEDYVAYAHISEI